jgi:hypothetical protein
MASEHRSAGSDLIDENGGGAGAMLEEAGAKKSIICLFAFRFGALFSKRSARV